jgi:hypothetical protein
MRRGVFLYSKLVFFVPALLPKIGHYPRTRECEALDLTGSDFSVLVLQTHMSQMMCRGREV